MQLGKPRETGDFADLAKMRAGLRLAAELLPSGTRVVRETRTGIDSFPPGRAPALHHLARSTLLQLMLEPSMIHIVPACEATHASTADDVVESAQLVRRCVRSFRAHRDELAPLGEDPIVEARAEHLVREAKTLLRAIADAEHGSELRELSIRLARPEVLERAVRRGLMAAPGITHPDYPLSRSFPTAPTREGYMECQDPLGGGVLYERERIARLGLAAAD